MAQVTRAVIQTDMPIDQAQVGAASPPIAIKLVITKNCHLATSIDPNKLFLRTKIKSGKNKNKK